MKRVIFGVIWFVVFLIVLNFVLGMIMGVAMSHAGVTAQMNFQQRLDASKSFMQAHAGTVAVWRVIILLVSIVLAVAGSVMGMLPGTRKKKIAVPAG